MDTRLQNFRREIIDKEAAVRMEWHLRYSKQFSKAARALKQQQQENNISPAGTRNGIRITSSTSKRIKKLEEERREMSPVITSNTQDKEETTGSQGPIKFQDMRPVSGNTRSLLYEGISHNEKGRYSYLQKRKLKLPEEKYEFPILTSCQYGWKILDFGMPKSSPFARTCVVRDTFFRPSGISVG